MKPFYVECSGHAGKCQFCGMEGEIIAVYADHKKAWCCHPCKKNHQYRTKFGGWSKWDESITSKETE